MVGKMCVCVCVCVYASVCVSVCVSLYVCSFLFVLDTSEASCGNMDKNQ